MDECKGVGRHYKHFLPILRDADIDIKGLAADCPPHFSVFTPPVVKVGLAAGITIFESQLRRVGLDPNHVPLQDKQLVVTRLGGHPVAIAFAADTSYDRGLDALVQDLR